MYFNRFENFRQQPKTLFFAELAIYVLHRNFVSFIHCVPFVFFVTVLLYGYIIWY